MLLAGLIAFAGMAGLEVLPAQGFGVVFGILDGWVFIQLVLLAVERYRLWRHRSPADTVPACQHPPGTATPKPR